MTIYSNRYLVHNQNSKFNGFILYSLDSPYWGVRAEEPDFIPWYRRMVKHETTHVIQYYLCGGSSNVHIWFTEGVAEWASEDLPVTTWQQVEEWRQNPEHINPIKIHIGADYPLPLERIIEYYPLFGLAVQYLMDGRGRGKTPLDVKHMFLDIRGGMKFAEAFELHMGLTVDYYEARFWEWMEAYLPATCD
jgi:hypothetical protein